MPVDWIDEEVAAIGHDLESALSPQQAAEDDLALTGLEPLLIMLALKAATGVASGFAGRAAFDKWKKSRGQKQYEQLKEQLRVTEKSEPIDEAEIRHELITGFVEQGLSAKNAGSVVDKALGRARNRAIGDLG